MISVRNVLVVLALAFTAYLAARGLWWTAPVPQPLVVIAALGLYLVTTWLCIFWEPRRTAPTAERGSSTTPLTAGSRTALPLLGRRARARLRVLVPSAIAVAVGPESRTAPFATWYLGGIGALMTIVMVRRRPWIAWVGIAALAVASMAWMGPLNALALGLVGSRRVGRSALSCCCCRWTAPRATPRGSRSCSARHPRGRRRRPAVSGSGACRCSGRSRSRDPCSTRTVASGGRSTRRSALEARLAEGRLRDEMRAPRLLDEAVRAELERARRRGANVTVLDEGGLDGLDEAIARRHPRPAGRDAARGAVGPPLHPHVAARAGRGHRRGPLGRRAGAVRTRTPSTSGARSTTPAQPDVARPRSRMPRVLAPRPGGGGEPGRGAESEEARGGEAARPSPSGQLPENRPRGRTWAIREW